MVEAWMDENDIKLMMVQETHLNRNCKEVRKNYTCFFSGSRKKEDHTYAGVAIVIKNTWVKFVQDVGPISDRIMWMSLGYTMPFTFINAYVPTAQHSYDEKMQYMNRSKRHSKRNQNGDQHT